MAIGRGPAPAAPHPAKEGPVYLCSLCRSAVPLDDTLITTARGGCICLRCYLRHVDDDRRLPGDLRRQLAEVAAES